MQIKKIAIRIPDHVKEIIENAAALKGVTIQQFILDSVTDKANEVVGRNKLMVETTILTDLLFGK